MSWISKKLRAFIPHKISNNMVLSFFEITRSKNRTLKREYCYHLESNNKAFSGHVDKIKRNGGYIEDQHFYKDMVFGKTTMQYAGCEIIATYNALVDLDGYISLPQLIAEYEKDGMALSGRFGTSPKAIKDFFNRHGYKTKMSVRSDEFEELAKHSKSLILTMYNDKDDIGKQVHTVCISKVHSRYIAHNVYGNGRVAGPFDSVSQLLININKGRIKPISLIGVK